MTDTISGPSSTTGSTLDSDFESTRDFTSPPDAVFDALITPSAITNWWVDVSGSGLEGGELIFQFGDKPLVIRVAVAERPSLVRWAVLSCEPVPDWVGTTISFAISPTETGGSRLHFKHNGLTPQLECFDMCKKGWEHYLPSLVEYVDTGEGSRGPGGSGRAG